ncbi:hypothetical protein QQS21_006389 [Conoideocrella luteorostrata]|uniref:Helicase C-terminal domain-containing protein n=1 Tax=Conoideocrella luteorostrata TaxID=1105319 RepID=A0AAJ0FSZ2_9HYPO|nr:hypothetical protein QQS21_006389 [Conoideocrella luteorostrata]
MHLQGDNFVPTGCLGISLAQSSIDKGFWDAASLKSWKRFRHHHQPLETGARDHVNSEHHLSGDAQKLLFQLEELRLPAILFSSRWIDLEFCVNSNGLLGTLRVYFLPDDAYRGVVDKTNIALKRTRRLLLHSLDYSKNAWDGLSAASPGNSLPWTREPSVDDEHATLLQVFNNIPSPSPDQNLVSDTYFRDAMSDLLKSTITGLLTNLHPYQRRSTALMVQKEAEQGAVLDPRLVAVEGQDGSTWYADPVMGTILKEPRYYEGVAGGVLAEEMGSGKTIICLALILASRNLPTRSPEVYGGGYRPTRHRIGSLADMAASCATRNAVPWRSYFETWKRQLGYEFGRCEQALRRNPGYFFRPAPKVRRTGRNPVKELSDAKIYLSNATVIIVPNNLVSQWKQEIAKHTTGLNIRVLANRQEIPSLDQLLELDIVLFSQSRFESLVRYEGGVGETALSAVHFKRCIVDEGHKLGNSKIGRKSNLLIGLDRMSFSSKWIVTGTPSHGLFGVDDRAMSNVSGANGDLHALPEKEPRETSAEMEKKDLERLGSITALYLKARPWANTITEHEDTPADWGTYLLLPRHKKNSHGNWGSLRATLNSLIIRHRLSEIGDLLPPVDEKVIVLDGSYQDRLSLNLFAMMIIFNSVQSQRTDMDYFFHPRQRKSLLQIVHNLKQSSFFGASFFTSEEIAKSVETAEKFLEEGNVPIGDEDRALLFQAISLGRVAIADKLRNLSNRYHEIPVLVHGPLGSASQAWSLDGEGGDTICTSASMISSLQRLLSKAAHAPESLNSLLNGGLIQEGLMERGKLLAAQESDKVPHRKEKKNPILAGNTKLGDDTRRHKSRSQAKAVDPTEGIPANSLPPSLLQTNLISTVSAKLSYLVDSVLRHQDKEKIIIFYENENVAWYLANMLDVLQVQHLIYAKTLTSERKAQYVNTFHHNHVFRVLLMDLSQAAFGLDMREASRIYFINPVLNPQVEAQAIGRVRRISQQKPVSVETLVLKDSIDEVILERKQHMTQAEHRQMKSILDVRPIYNWIKNVTILDLPRIDIKNASHMINLGEPRPIFGRGFGRELHPDDGLVSPDSPIKEHSKSVPSAQDLLPTIPTKRKHDVGPGLGGFHGDIDNVSDSQEIMSRPARRVRFTSGSDSGG